MTVEELEFLPIEEIIWLKDFISLISKDGIDDSIDEYSFPRIEKPHWELTFRARPDDKGNFWFLNLKSPFNRVKVIKLKQ
jgi:hypothetical protein